MKRLLLIIAFILTGCGLDSPHEDRDPEELRAVCLAEAESFKPWLISTFIPALRLIERGDASPIKPMLEGLSPRLEVLKTCYMDAHILEREEDQRLFFEVFSRAGDRLKLARSLLEKGETDTAVYPKAIEWAELAVEELKRVGESSPNDS